MFWAGAARYSSFRYLDLLGVARDTVCVCIYLYIYIYMCV